jgi:ABC-type transporter MlaC component
MIKIPSEKKLKQLEKRAARKAANKVMKASTAELRKRLKVQLGQRIKAMESLAEKAEKDATPYVDAALAGDQQAMFKLMGLDIPGMSRGKSIYKLAWLNGKMYIQSQGGRKNSPGLRSEFAEAFIENASRDFTKQVDEAQKPTPEVIPDVLEGEPMLERGDGI